MKTLLVIQTTVQTEPRKNKLKKKKRLDQNYYLHLSAATITKIIEI